ncbi:MAG: pilus assembly protein TadG-related protein [Terracidiphilus sp.]
MKLMKDESGQILALTVLSMTLLIACIALAVDVGVLFRAKRQAQIAADAAAVAGAMENFYHGSANAVAVGQAAGAANGIPSGDVAIIVGPTDGYHTGTGYVEARVYQPTQTVFMDMFVGGNVNVSARAVAGIVFGQACMIALDPNNAGSLTVKGNTTVKATNCGIQVNSSSPSAFCDNGNAKIDSPYVNIVGGQSTKGNCGKNPGSPVYSGGDPENDPIDLTGPLPNGSPGPPAVPPACTTGGSGNTVSIGGNNPTVTSATTIPSVGGVTCFSDANVTLSNVTLPAGTYVFENGVNISGNVTVNGGTLDIYQGSFNNSNGNLDISAPTTGTYNGIAIMQPASNTTATCQDNSIKHAINTSTCLQVQFGSSSATPPAGNLDGIIYAPTATVYLQDQGGGVQAAAIISYDIYVNSQLSITDNYSHAHPGTSPLSHLQLVE